MSREGEKISFSERGGGINIVFGPKYRPLGACGYVLHFLPFEDLCLEAIQQISGLMIICCHDGQAKNIKGKRRLVAFTRKSGLSIFFMTRFPLGTHNETWTSPDYYQTINYFLDEVKLSTLISVTSLFPST
jgi:hypothetical protein